MDKHQTIDLLSAIAAIDKRKIGQTEVNTWHMILGHLDLDDALQATAHHFATSTDYLMPVHIVTGVKRIRADRLDRSITAPPPAELSDDARAAQAWLQQQIKKIADGKAVNNLPALPPGERRPGPPPTEFERTRDAMDDDDGADATIRRAALRVACPHCGALPGKPCVLSGTTTPLKGKPAHDARIEAAGLS
ncbi:zinc finger domain-containing protein [Sphaerimonospora thailandensis]|uniref:DNA-binding phage zinc finger domain-containing protein n=1 Tax=Sphaerimonospora thailandensis TaxID=795644 RepID=A0A8J3R7W2_9ACTN|nr:hypothetical protein [Sphaerimonospora thailandensis]GIH69465.1 hypothetical protein Mth01_17180 [Sphaerimonospora thailandensis]